MLSKLNVNDLPKTGLKVKVVSMIPSGTVTTRVPRDEPTKNLVKNIACENWREVLKHNELAPEINIAIRKAVSKEFSDYLKCESMLFARNPDELAGFSNKLFMKEVRIHYPVWFNCQLGASGLSSKEEAVGGRVNPMAAGLIRGSRVAGHGSHVTGRRSQVAGRRSQVAGRRSQVAGRRLHFTNIIIILFVLSSLEKQNMFIVQKPFLSYTTFQ